LKKGRIPNFDEDWEKIEMLSRYYREEEGINITSSQIAAALVHAEVSKIDTSKIKFKTHSASK
jgi:hypothetical protein